MTERMVDRANAAVFAVVIGFVPATILAKGFSGTNASGASTIEFFNVFIIGQGNVIFSNYIS